MLLESKLFLWSLLLQASLLLLESLLVDIPCFHGVCACSCLLMFHLSAVHPPVANVLTAFYAPGVPAVTSVFAVVASSSEVDIPTATAVTNVSGAPACAGDHAIAGGPAFNVVPVVIASLRFLLMLNCSCCCWRSL